MRKKKSKHPERTTLVLTTYPWKRLRFSLKLLLRLLARILGMIRHFPSAHHAVWIPLSSTFWRRSKQSPPKANHRQPLDWLCYWIEALLQSGCGCRLRQITARKMQDSKKGTLKKMDTNLWPPHWESFISSNCHSNAFVWVRLGVNQSTVLWLLVMADTEEAKTCFYSLFMLLLHRHVTDSSEGRGRLRVVQGKQLMEELACLAILRSSSQPLLQRPCS